MARPSKYSDAVAAKLCAKLAEGQSLRKACSAKDMPSTATVFRWMQSIDGFREQYETAKAEATEHLVEEMLDIADDVEENPASRRVRVDTRKWIASKLKPKKYGDRVTHQGDDEAPLYTTIEHIIRDPGGKP